MALQCITLQWKITSLLIYLIIYGFFHLSSLINQDNLYKFQKHVINSIKQYERLTLYEDHSWQSKFWQTFIIKCNLKLHWMIYFINVITYILVCWCFSEYVSNTMPELMNQFLD